MFGSLRGSDYAWHTSEEKFINVLGCDLALYLGYPKDSKPAKTSRLHKIAKYIWELEDPDDWSEYLEVINPGRRWEVLFSQGSQWFGGIPCERDCRKNCDNIKQEIIQDLPNWNTTLHYTHRCEKQGGSGGFLLIFRYLIAQEIRKLKTCRTIR
eukprot:UN28459